MTTAATSSRATEILPWSADGHAFSLGLDRLGQGPRVLMLPALSSISTREEMHPLQQRLAARFEAIAVDWPGFGTAARPRHDWVPKDYTAFLDHLLTDVAPNPFATIAAGHAAGYLLHHLAAHPNSAGHVVLIAPTWRGPLPTVFEARKPIFETLAKAFDPPVAGPLLYALNVNPFVLRKMALGHVYAAPLDDEALRRKQAVTRAEGARHASARFVTGHLDPFHRREDFLDAARGAEGPILVIAGEATPRRSRAEMQALAALGNVETVWIARGKLGLHEEMPDAVAAPILDFLTSAEPVQPRAES